MILRNASTPFVALWAQLQLSWFWRSRARHGILRPLPFIALAICHISLFALASLFSSRVSQKSANVLIRSPNCGYFTVPAADQVNGTIKDATLSQLEHAFAQINYIDGLVTQSSNYVRTCNGSAFPSYVDCNIYFQQPFQGTTVSTNDCPFADKACLDAENGITRIDTGLLDSNLALGINAPPQNRLAVRKVTECAPIQSVPYQSSSTSDFTEHKIDTLQFLYGPGSGLNTTYSLTGIDAFLPRVPYNIS